MVHNDRMGGGSSVQHKTVDMFMVWKLVVIISFTGDPLSFAQGRGRDKLLYPLYDFFRGSAFVQRNLQK